MTHHVVRITPKSTNPTLVVCQVSSDILPAQIAADMTTAQIVRAAKGYAAEKRAAVLDMLAVHMSEEIVTTALNNVNALATELGLSTHYPISIKS